MDPDQTARSSLIRIHTVCLYAKIDFEKFARRFSRRHKQTTFSDAGFLGILRVKFWGRICCIYSKWAEPWENIFRHMQTAKDHISLHFHSVWLGLSLFANRIIGYKRLYEWRAKAQILLCTCAGWSESAHFVHVWRHFFTWHSQNRQYCLSKHLTV